MKPSSPLIIQRAEGALRSLDTSGYAVIRNADSAYRLFSHCPSYGALPTHLSEVEIPRLLHRLGEQFGITPAHYEREGDGAPFTHISPSERHPKSMSPLRGHTDGAFLRLPGEAGTPLPLIPELIALYCVRNFDGVSTTISPARDLVASLGTRTLRDLQAPIYSFSKQASWTYDGTEIEKLPARSVLSLGQDGPLVRFSHSAVSSNHEAGRVALEQLSQALARTEIQVSLQPGDLLVLDNLRTVHGRKSAPVSTNMGPAGRWLIRSYFKRNWKRQDENS